MAMTFTPFPALLVYIGFTLNFFAVLSVAASVHLPPPARAGAKTRVVSFAWPMIPVFFILVGSWITVVGVTLQPAIAFAAIVTIATGALVYHFRLVRQRKPSAKPTC